MNAMGKPLDKSLDDDIFDTDIKYYPSRSEDPLHDRLEIRIRRRRDDGYSSAISPISIMSCLDWLTHYDIMSKIGHYLSRSYMTIYKERNALLFIVKS